MVLLWLCMLYAADTKMHLPNVCMLTVFSWKGPVLCRVTPCFCTSPGAAGFLLGRSRAKAPPRGLNQQGHCPPLGSSCQGPAVQHSCTQGWCQLFRSSLQHTHTAAVGHQSSSRQITPPVMEAARQMQPHPSSTRAA